MSSEEHFRSIFDLAAIGLAQCDVQTHRFVVANHRMEEINGPGWPMAPTQPEALRDCRLLRAGLLQMSFQDITYPADLKTDVQQMHKLIAGEVQTYSTEKRYIKKDRSIVWVNRTASVLRSRSGQPESFIAVIEDISARKEMELRLTMALEAGKMGTWDWDLKTNELTWSETLQKIFSFEPGVFQGVESVWSRIYPEDAERVKSTVLDAVKHPSEFEVEHRIVWPDESIHWVYVTGKALCDALGEPVRMCGTGTEITARKRNETAIRFLADASAALASSLDYPVAL